MSDTENISLRADLSKLNKDIEDAYRKVEGLREQFKTTGRDISREMEYASRGIKVLQVAMGESEKTIRSYSGIQRKLSSQLREAGVNTSRLAEAQRRYANASGESELAIKRNIENLMATREEIRRAREEKDQYANTITSLRQRLMMLADAQKEAANSAGEQGLGGALRGLRSTANQLAGVFGFGFGIYGAVRALRDAARVVREFENTQKQLEAITAANASQMQELSRQAVVLGSNSKYGAAGVSELQVQLARMGFTIREIGDMAPGIINLATATQEDLGKAAETVANILRAFNMDAMETVRVTDAMAFSFTQSALDLERFRQSIKYIAPIANQANFSIEETASLLAKLADAGIYGSLAGTSLRNVIRQLSDSTSNLSQRVGMTIGGFDDFVEALRRLNEQGTNLEDVFNIMDTRAASAFAIILDGVDDIEAMRQKMDEAAGAAERMARVQRDSLTFQSKLLRAQWEGMILSFDRGNSIMSVLAKDTMARLSSGLGNVTRALNRESRQVAENVNMIDLYSKQILDNSAAMETRMDVLKELQALYPQYLRNLDESAMGTERLARALDRLRKAQEGELELAVANEELDKFTTDLETRERDALQLNQIANKERLKTVDIFRLMSVQFRYMFQSGQTLGEKMTESLAGARQQTQWLARDVRALFLKMGAPAEVAASIDITSSVDANIQEYQRLMDELTESGATALDAFNKSSTAMLDGVSESISGQSEGIRELEQTRDSLYQKMDEGQEVSEEELDGINKAIRAREIQREILLRLLGNLKQYIDAQGSAYRDEVANSQNLLRLQQRLAELRATEASNEISLQKQLIQIRRQYGLQMAELIEDQAERELQLQIVRQEYVVALQSLNNQIIQEEHRLSREQARAAQQLNDTLLAIYEERAQMLMTTTNERAIGERYRIEITQAELANQRIIEGIKSRENELLEVAKSNAQQRLSQVADDAELEARIRKELEDEITRIMEQAEAERMLQQLKFSNIIIGIRRSQTARMVDLAKTESDERIASFEREQEAAQVIFESRRRSDQERRRFEREQHRERLRMLIEEREAVLAAMVEERNVAAARGETDVVENIDRDIKQARESLDLLILRFNNPEFDQAAWDEMIDAIRRLADETAKTFQRMLQERERFAREERSILDRRVSETQRSIEIELRLNEQGFASNVQAKMAELEELKSMRDKALKEEQKAAKQRMQLDAAMQAVNLLTAVSNILRAESLKGLAGIALAATGIGALWGLWANARRLAQRNVTYEKGGSFMLNGPSHNRGGVMIAPGHEGQGGEMVSVYNRSATKKFGPQIKAFEQAINKGVDPTNVTVYAGNKDLKAIRKLMETSTDYYNGYRITRRGNNTTRCRLN